MRLRTLREAVETAAALGCPVALLPLDSAENGVIIEP